jgi:hypothetical protein
MAAIIIGLGAGIFCYLAVRLRNRTKLKVEAIIWSEKRTTRNKRAIIAPTAGGAYYTKFLSAK